MENEVLLTSRELRDANMDKVYVLEKVKKLMTIPETDYITTQMVANYYEVSDDTIQIITKNHMDELQTDGVRKITCKDFLNRNNSVQEIKKQRGVATILFNDGSSFKIPNLGVRIYPKRAILRIGMLLRDSEIAKSIRTVLLDNNESYCAVDSHITESLLSSCLNMMREDRERYMAVIRDKDETIADLKTTAIELKSMLTDSLKVISADRAVFSDVMNKQHKLIVDLVDKSQTASKCNITKEQKELLHEYATTTPSEKNLDGVSWKQNINELLKVVCDETKREKNMVLSDAYKMMKSLYGIDINLYQREYHATIKTPRVPSMFDTICWMETKRETSLNGTMERILWSMLDDVQVVA